MTIWILLVLMAAITFSSRYLLLMQSIPIALGPRIRRLLTYTAPAVLTALWVPIVFKPTSELAQILAPEYAVAALVAAVLSKLHKNPLVAVILSFVTFILVDHFIA